MPLNEDVIQALAGSVAGMGAMTVTYPLTFISTRSAVSSKDKDSTEGKQSLGKVIKEEGIKGVYSGLSSSLLGIAVTNGIYYFAYSATTSKARARTGTLTVAQSMTAGMIAGSITTLLTNPIWTIQATQSTSTLASPNAAPLSIPQTIKHLYKTGGLAAFWRGIGAALVLVINPVLQYTAFEQLKRLLLARRLKSGGKLKLGDGDVFLIGALAKLFATSLTYPYILVKSRSQANSHQYPSIISALSQILRKEGIEGLYRGISSKLLQSVLTAALLFLGQNKIVEAVKEIVEKVAVAA